MLKAIVLIVVMGSCMGTGAAMQSPSSQPPFGAQDPFGLPADSARHGDGDIHHALEAQRVRSASVERQRQMTREANELLNLAGELQFKAQRNDDAATQAEMLHQLETIEKLAHNVKERMRDEQ